MMEKPVIFGKKGRTTIPLPMRRKLGWKAGDTIRFRLDGDKVIISRDRPPAQPAEQPPDLAKALALFVFSLLGGGASG